MQLNPESQLLSQHRQEIHKVLEKKWKFYLLSSTDEDYVILKTAAKWILWWDCFLNCFQGQERILKLNNWLPNDGI